MQRECFLKGILDARYFSTLDTPASAGLWQSCEKTADVCSHSALRFVQVKLMLHFGLGSRDKAPSFCVFSYTKTWENTVEAIMPTDQAALTPAGAVRLKQIW